MRWKLVPFDVDKFKELVDETDAQVEKFEDDDVIVLLIGISGAGKSTLI